MACNHKPNCPGVANLAESLGGLPSDSWDHIIECIDEGIDSPGITYLAESPDSRRSSIRVLIL